MAYSRNGKPIESIPHITAELEDRLVDDETIDGELYIHGEALQNLSSLIKRKQPESEMLKFHGYDYIAPDIYNSRYSALYSILSGNVNSGSVPTKKIESMEEVMKGFRGLRKHGYEGAILRWGDAGYEDDKRSKSLVKIKAFFDEEFKVIDIIPSKDGWARLELLNHDGNTFMVSAPGTMDDKYYVMDNAQEYLGRYVTVEYAELTKDKVPFHPIATAWRDKESE